MKIMLLIVSTLVLSSPASAKIGGYGNTQIESFSKAKKLIYKVHQEQKKTLYCNASFNNSRRITSNPGFSTNIYKKRALRTEVEHLVPAENFGRAFTEWREGHPLCVDSKGRDFKGRKCAEKSNKEYRLMQSDAYNLVPVVGAVNAARSNYNFNMLGNGDYLSFGSCQMYIDKNNRRAQPPERARGQIARAYLYMDAVYPKYKMSSQQRKLMSAWDTLYPVSQWECERGVKIKEVQGNVNPILEQRCLF